MEEASDDGIEGVQFRGKEIVPSNAMFGNDWRESPQQVYSDSLLGLDLNKYSMNEPPVIDSHLNNGNEMVEELTLQTNPIPIPIPISNSNSSVVVVGSSNNSVRERMQTSRQGHWNHLYQLAGGLGGLGSLGSGGSHCENVSKDKGLDLGGIGNSFIPEFGAQRQLQQSNPQSSEMPRRLGYAENGSESPSGIRTKLLTSSRFPQFLVKNNLKGKAVVRKPRDEFVSGAAIEQSNQKVGYGIAGIEQKGVSVGKVVSEPAVDLGLRVSNIPRHTVDSGANATATDGILLREWLKPGHKVNRNENMRIFKQIVELVDIAHSQQVDLQYLRPSSFKLLPSNHVKYVGSSFVGRDSFGSGIDTEVTSMANHSSRKRVQKESCPSTTSLNSKRHKLFKSMNFTRQQSQFSAGSAYKCESGKEVDMNDVGSQDSGYDTSQNHHLNSEHRTGNRFGIPFSTTQYQFTAAKFQLEEKWYTTPEEHNRRERTIFSDIYCLGVLLFELFCCHESWEVHTAAMLDLRHRILPPKFLSEYPKEAGFCLWLLHPEPTSRPRARDILNSELICESREVSEGRLLLPVEEDHTESELLLHFLSTLKEIKRKRASNLVEEIKGMEADIKEVEKRHLLRTTGDPLSNTREILLKETPPSQARLMKSMSQLESAYFSMRSQIQLSDTDRTSRSDKDLLRSRESWSQVQNEDEGNLKPTDYLGAFFDGLCKYARYSKFELRGTLRNGDLLNSANVICSLSFDRDEEYFAAAGVAKKIKIFEFRGLLNNSIDIHYPVVEMTSKSKLSCVCWNNYIKNYLAATDYDGVVQLWDASTGQGFSQYIEHDKRAWSVDFSRVDPTKLASGSDDCTVKLWNINERKSISTIRSAANVCCVQFSAHSTHLLALGSADYKTYCYDLRNTRSPWCTLAGHGKAVSYVKFLDSETLVSASTDNTLKLWDLNKTSCSGLSTDSCSLTFRGHTNEKNFVGLSVADGYITCGSESNEVYAYHRSLPMPITSHKFGSLDPVSGQENADDCGQFVSSVCWKGKSDMVIAANSSGSIKLLQMM